MSSACYQLCTGLLWLMTVSIDTGNYVVLLLKSYSSQKLSKINFVMPEDTAITSSKSDVGPSMHDEGIDLTKKCGQTYDFLALYT